MNLFKYKKIIDLRSPREIMKYGKIPNSKNIHFDLFKHMIESKQFDSKHPTIIYCWSGLRSSYALYFAKKHNYHNIQDLFCGFKLFKKFGMKKYKNFINNNF